MKKRVVVQLVEKFHKKYSITRDFTGSKGSSFQLLSLPSGFVRFNGSKYPAYVEEVERKYRYELDKLLKKLKSASNIKMVYIFKISEELQ